MTYRAGVIGTGGIAGLGILGLHDEDQIGSEKVRASHAGGYEAADGIELVAAADVDREKLDTFGEAWEIPPERRYDDHRAMLEAEDLDAVSVCTPSLLHAEHVLDAVEVGDPDVVWCEKPIAASVSDAEEMVDACEAADTDLLVNHSFRFSEKIRRLRDAVAEEDLVGNVHSVSVQFRMELMRNATHVFDLLGWLLDADPARVAGHVTGENEAVDALQADRRVDDAGGGGFVVYDDGTFATVDCTVPRDASSMTFQVLGSDGKLYLNNDDAEWRYWALEDGAHVETGHPAVADGWTWAEDYASAFPNAARHVVELLDGTAENRSPGRVAVESLAVIVATYVAHYTASQVDLPLPEPLCDVTVTSW